MADGSAKLDVEKAEVNRIVAELEAAAPVHKRDLEFLENLDKGFHGAKKACAQLLTISHNLGIELASALQHLQNLLVEPQVCQHR